MSQVMRNRLLSYGIAALNVAVALLLMLLLDPLISMTESPFLLFFGALTVSAWYGGKGPGIAATVLSALIANYFFIGQPDKLEFNLFGSARIFIFLLEGIVISVLCGALRTSQERTQVSLQKLRVSEARFRRLVDSNIIGVVFADTHGAIADANDAFLNMIGYSRQDVLAGRLRWDELTPPDLRHLDVPALEELRVKGKNTPYEKEYFHKDGHRVPILVGTAILEDESRENVIAFILDLTKRKQVEKALRESEEKYRQIVETANEGIWLIDAQSRTTYVNPQMSQMLGYSVEEMIGLSLFDFIHKQDQEKAECRLEERKQGFNGDADFRLRCKDGSTLWIRSRTSRILNDNGEVLGILTMVTDITERKRAEEALAESQQLFLSFMNYIPGAAYVKDEQGRYLYVNPIIERILNCNQAEILGKTDFDFFPVSIAQPIRDSDIAVFAQGTPMELEETILQENREHYWMSFKFLIKDGSGKQMLAGMSCDITERKLAEQERSVLLQQLEIERSRFEAVLRHMPAGVIIADGPSGKTILANEQVDSILGYPSIAAQEIEHYAQYTAIHKDGSPFLAHEYPLVRSLTTGEAIENQEIDYVRGDGSYGTMLISSTPIYDSQGEISTAVVIFHNITERKRTEEALKQSQELLKLAHQIGKIGTCEWNLKNHKVTWTEEMESLFGMPPGSFDGRYESWVQALHPSDRDRTDDLAQRFAAGEAEFDTEFRIVWSNGTVRWIAAKAVILKDEAGKPERIVGVNMDITEHKQALADRTQLLERERAARSEAEAINRIKDEFLAVLSHELRTPLNPILGWAKLLQNNQYDSKTTSRALETIERNAKLQIQLIDDLLDVSRILRGKLSLNVAPVELAPCIDAAMETVRLAAQAKSMDVRFLISDFELESDRHEFKQETSFPVPPPSKYIVLGDASRLQQIVWNLLSNAVKFTPNGGSVEVRLQREVSNAQIIVQDTGKGINPDFLPYVFDSFRQENSTTTRVFGGLGLGLAIVRHLVELHGGSVKVESPGEGLGSTFTVTLPLMIAEQTITEENGKHDDLLMIKGVRVLVVDDDTDNLELITFILEEYGMEVRAVASAREALSIFPQWQPDLLLSDIGMPEMDGYTLIGHIRSLSAAQGGLLSGDSESMPKAIALTAYAGEINHQQALSAGFQKHLTKPVVPRDLVLAIVDTLRPQ